MKYQIDREKFLRYYILDVAKLCHINTIIKFMILGGEYIITTEEVLTTLDVVSTKVLHNYRGIPGTVLASDCEIIYV